MNDFFCPAPWNSIFYHTNKAAVCCISSKKFDMSPVEFLNSDYLKDLRQKFLNNEFDDTCTGCRDLEKQGLQSIRKHMLRGYGVNTIPKLEYMELRASNLCNFQCTICNAENSSSIGDQVLNITDKNWNEIMDMSLQLKALTLTGGEPMLIKFYYELLDHLILNNKTDINLRIYTNGSVYNPKFIEKINKFNTTLYISIDAVGKTAEELRIGTNWQTVSSNIELFLKEPINICLHSTISNTGLLDVYALSEYFVKIKNDNPKCRFNIHTVLRPKDLSVYSIHEASSIRKALDEINKSLAILIDPDFLQIVNQLKSYKKLLEKRL